MKIALSTVIGLFIGFHCLFAAPYVPKDEIKKDGDWSLVCVVLNQGTRSQIVLGKLKYNEIEVVGKQGHVLELPFGRYVWHGSYDQGYLRGWIPIAEDLDIQYLKPAEIPNPPTTLGGIYYTKEKG